jgi:hypothetical protein
MDWMLLIRIDEIRACTSANMGSGHEPHEARDPIVISNRKPRLDVSRPTLSSGRMLRFSDGFGEITGSRLTLSYQPATDFSFININFKKPRG